MRNASRLNHLSSDEDETRRTSAYIRLAYSGNRPVAKGPTPDDTCDYIYDLTRELEGLARKAGQPNLVARLTLVREAVKLERDTQ
jgi:hypothetical protein